jgi:hypothetical protein
MGALKGNSPPVDDTPILGGEDLRQLPPSPSDALKQFCKSARDYWDILIPSVKEALQDAEVNCAKSIICQFVPTAQNSATLTTELCSVLARTT